MKTEKKLAPGHNPDLLTVKQVGKGWRLLTREENKARAGGNETLAIQAWDYGKWQATHLGIPWTGNGNMSYRTRKPAGYFLPKKVKAVKPEWEYSRYRATLKRNGKTFAIVSPNGKDALSEQDAATLTQLLNR